MSDIQMIVLAFLQINKKPETGSTSKKISLFPETESNFLEALPVYNAGARLVVFLFGDPHLLES